MTKTALVAGVTGITGQAIATLLHAQGWRVLGLARNPLPLPGVEPIAADLTDAAATTAALAGQRPALVRSRHRR